MNWDRIEGSWMQWKGKVRQQWGELMEDDFDILLGRRDELAGKVRERDGIAKDEARRQMPAPSDRAKEPQSSH